MAIWVLSPLGAVVGGRSGLFEAVTNSFYLGLAWGGAYAVGRMMLGQAEGRKDLLVGIVLGGIAYLPICLAEGIMGPWIYRVIYGFQPLQWVGAERYLGTRPIGFLEDGNQLGIWMAGAALAAYGCWRGKCEMPWSHRWMMAIVIVLMLAALGTQSVGAIILLGLGVIGLEVLRWSVSWFKWMGALVIILLIIGCAARITMSGSMKHIAKETVIGRVVVEKMKALSRGSLGWRIGREEAHIHRAGEHLLVGWGRWDWWREGTHVDQNVNDSVATQVSENVRPWCLWLLAIGQVGIIGTIAIYGLLAGISVQKMLINAGNGVMGKAGTAVVLAVILLMAIGDSLLNAGVILPWIMACGSLVLVKKQSIFVG